MVSPVGVDKSNYPFLKVSISLTTIAPKESVANFSFLISLVHSIAILHSM